MRAYPDIQVVCDTLPENATQFRQAEKAQEQTNKQQAGDTKWRPGETHAARRGALSRQSDEAGDGTSGPRTDRP